MKLHTYIRSSVTLGALAGALLLPASVSAQATLQNTTSNLQPQSATNQVPVNTQTQSGTLQNNSGSVLNQGAAAPLGVVSTPNQSQPDAVVEPSETLTAQTSANQTSSNTAIVVTIAIVTLLAAVLGFYALNKRSSDSVTETIVETPVIRPEPAKVPKKVRNKSTAKKKKSRKR